MLSALLSTERLISSPIYSEIHLPSEGSQEQSTQDIPSILRASLPYILHLFPPLPSRIPWRGIPPLQVFRKKPSPISPIDDYAYLIVYLFISIYDFPLIDVYGYNASGLARLGIEMFLEIYRIISPSRWKSLNSLLLYILYLLS